MFKQIDSLIERISKKIVKWKYPPIYDCDVENLKPVNGNMQKLIILTNLMDKDKRNYNKGNLWVD